MATIALRLQVFISSPSDVQHEREMVERVVLRLSRDVARHHLLLSVYRFEHDGVPSCERPLDYIAKDLRDSELVIGIFGRGVGSAARHGSSETGTQEELRIAEQLVRTGRADDLFLYYRTRPGSNDPVPEISDYISPLIAKRAQILWPYADIVAFEALLESHLKRWLENWYQIPEICRHAFESSDLALQHRIPLGENRLDNILRVFDMETHREIATTIGLAVVHHCQQHGALAVQLPLPIDLEELPPLVVRDDSRVCTFVHPEAFYFFAGVGLAQAIRTNDWTAVHNYPYPNNVHQYLSAILLRSSDLERCRRVLCDWLRRRSGPESIRPTARNFAAYVLGMIGAHDAADQLADSLQNDKGADVRTYCITSLGKLRSRRHLPLLRRIYRSSSSSDEQELIAKAVCRIVGIARFEL